MEATRIVITGGPGGGKSTAVDLFDREFGRRVHRVPEAATILFAGGLPRVASMDAVENSQRAIFHLQRALESAHAASNPGCILLCDRGTVDGAAFWPDGPEKFFASVGSTMEAELAHYDAVLFFESAAVRGADIRSNNPQRIESLDEAAVLDGKLRDLWSKHPNFTLVPSTESFLAKIQFGLSALRPLLNLN